MLKIKAGGRYRLLRDLISSSNWKVVRICIVSTQAHFIGLAASSVGDASILPEFASLVRA